MQEIKFRYTFKRKEDGRIYQLIVPIGVLEDGHGEIFSMLKNDLWELVSRDQFTGLHDKNKEIYGGDIIKWDDGDEYIIKFIKNEGCWGTVSNLWLCNCNWRGHIEVIDNIYENPELIKSAD